MHDGSRLDLVLISHQASLCSSRILANRGMVPLWFRPYRAKNLLLTPVVGKLVCAYLRTVVKKRRNGRPIDSLNVAAYETAFYLTCLPVHALREMWLLQVWGSRCAREKGQQKGVVESGVIRSGVIGADDCVTWSLVCTYPRRPPQGGMSTCTHSIDVALQAQDRELCHADYCVHVPRGSRVHSRELNSRFYLFVHAFGVALVGTTVPSVEGDPRRSDAHGGV